MSYRTIVEKYIRYMKSSKMLDGESELILKASIVDEAEINWEKLYHDFIRDYIFIIPHNYWDKDEIDLIVKSESSK